MRMGVSSRGSTWVSMGPIGWMIVGPFILAFYLGVLAVCMLVMLGKGVVALVQAISQSSQQKRALR